MDLGLKSQKTQDGELGGEGLAGKSGLCKFPIHNYVLPIHNYVLANPLSVRILTDSGPGNT